MRLMPALLCLLLLVTPLIATAQQAYVPIQNRLSAEQMRASGLDTLSDQQLNVLNALLSNEQAVVEQRVEETTRNRFAGLFNHQDVEPVRSPVKGEFRSWFVGKVIELENGQRWRVTEGELRLRHPLTAPMATITPGRIGGWYLQVEGQTAHAKVKRLP